MSHCIILSACCLLLAAQGAPLAAASKTQKWFSQGRKAELAGQYDQALELYERAHKEEPEHQLYLMAVRKMRFAAGQHHVDLGQKFLTKGSLLEAAAEFEKAAAVDPASSIAEQQLRRTLEMISKRGAPKSGAASPAQPDPEAALGPIGAARKETEALLEAAQSLPKLKPISTQPINLKINNNSRVIFETVGKLAGINVLFDPEYQDRRVSLELGNATLHEALDYVSTIAKAFWKPLSANAIFVTNDNQTKRRDYEEQVLKTFYLSNVYTAQELQEIATAVRGVSDFRRVFTVNSLNALVIRGEADKMALVEKVIHDIDKSRPEVIIDVLVLEASQSKTRELGITPLSGGPGINIPVVFTPRNPVLIGNGNGGGDGGTGGTGTGGTGTGGSTAISLAKIGNVGSNDFSLTLPGATIKALMSSSDTRVLQAPRIRGFDNQKASLRIGDRIPIATGSFQPGIGGVGINPLVNTQFNYQDVGVNVDIQPRIHAGREISMHVEIEISNVRDRVNIGGIEQPIIGQRRINHDIRLKEGEANVIGGLMQMQTTRVVSGVPVLAQLPLLGRLFSNERFEKSQNEILIVLVPHVVRMPELTDLNFKGIGTGSETTVKVSMAPAPNGHPALPPLPPASPPAAAPPPGPPAVGPPGASPAASSTPLAAAPPASGPTAAGQPASVPPAASPPVPTPPPGAVSRAEKLVSRLRFEQTPVEGTPGARFTLNLLAENVTDLFGVPMRVTYDPKLLQLADVRRGALLASDGQEVIVSKNIENDRGEASINLSRFPGSAGISGSGVLVVLEFQATAAGKAVVNLSNIAARNVRLEPIPLEAAPAEVVVK